MTISRESLLKQYSQYFEGAVWLIFIVLAGAYTFDFDDPLQVYRWGPAHWPRVVLCGMLVAAFWLLLYESRQTRKSEKKSASIDIPLSTRVHMGLIFFLPLLYAYLIHKMGFLLITPFFLCVYMWVVGVKKIRTLIIMTVGIYAAIVIIFVKLIFTYLPAGAGFFNALNGHILALLQ